MTPHQPRLVPRQYSLEARITVLRVREAWRPMVKVMPAGPA